MVGLGFVFSLSSACSQGTAEGAENISTPRTQEGIAVETLGLVQQDFNETFQTPGLLEAYDDVTISAETSGRITAISHQLGDRVAKGELLAAIDDRPVQARLKKLDAEIGRATAELEWAHKDLQRQRSLVEIQISAETILDEAARRATALENVLAAALADREEAQVELARARITSQIAGVVSRKHVSLGEYVTPGTQLFDVVATDRMKFTFSVGEHEITRLAPGQTLEVRIDALEGEVFHPLVRGIAPASHPETRTFRVELVLDNPPPRRLRAGMSGRVEVVRHHHRDVFIVPQDAVLRQEGQELVYLAQDSVAQPATVEVLSEFGAHAVIRGDHLDLGEAIIVGQHAVETGSRVEVRRSHSIPPNQGFD